MTWSFLCSQHKNQYEIRTALAQRKRTARHSNILTYCISIIFNRKAEMNISHMSDLGRNILFSTQFKPTCLTAEKETPTNTASDPVNHNLCKHFY